MCLPLALHSGRNSNTNNRTLFLDDFDDALGPHHSNDSFEWDDFTSCAVLEPVDVILGHNVEYRGCGCPFWCCSAQKEASWRGWDAEIFLRGLKVMILAENVLGDSCPQTPL